MRLYNNKIGYKITDIIYEYEPSGIGRNELVRISGYAKDTIDEWLDRLRNFGFIRLYPKYPVHLTEDAIQKYNSNNLIIPPDSNSKKVVDKNPMKRFLKRELGKNYAEIIILILCLAAFGSIKVRKYKKPKLGLVVVPSPIDGQKQYIYGINTKYSSPEAGIGLSDLIDKLPNKSSYSLNKKAVLPKYYTNYGNNELFGYLRLPKYIAQKSIKLLSEEYKILIPITRTNTNNEIRYEIYDELLREFVEQCILAFNTDVDPRLEYAYIYDFMDKIQVKEYFKSLRIWYGRNRKYSNIRSFINRLKDKGIDDISKEHYRKYIHECDKDIFYYELFEPKIIKCGYDEYKLIISKKYKPLQEKYPWIRNIFFDVLFPQFLRKIWYYQKNHNSSK